MITEWSAVLAARPEGSASDNNKTGGWPGSGTDMAKKNSLLLSGIKPPVTEGENSKFYSTIAVAKVKNKCIFTSSPSHAFMTRLGSIL
jgi:hypothetical protein